MPYKAERWTGRLFQDHDPQEAKAMEHLLKVSFAGSLWEGIRWPVLENVRTEEGYVPNKSPHLLTGTEQTDGYTRWDQFAP